MDKADRTRYRQLANDAVIATFGESGLTSQLAEALEKCVDELELIATDCEHCKTCEHHGDVEDDSIPVDADEVFRIHGELKKQVQAFKDLRGKFDNADDATEIPELVNELSLQIEELESEVDDLEVQVMI